MILYNMRNRGPYEYDKFTLNVLQIANAVNLSEFNELKNLLDNKNTLLWMQKEINDSHSKITGYAYENKSIAEDLYIKSFFIEGEL